MSLPDSYTTKPGTLPAYFEAIQNAEAPQRFSTRFLESLDFKSPNDRLVIRVLKDLGFLDTDGAPQQRYFDFLDRTQSSRVLAEAIRDCYSDLFAINREAYRLSSEEVKNKLRTLYGNTKSIDVISRVASTFAALCGLADFEAVVPAVQATTAAPGGPAEPPSNGEQPAVQDGGARTIALHPLPQRPPPNVARQSFDALQYHINIVLPESRDQAVYDAIFKSLREHLQ